MEVGEVDVCDDCLCIGGVVEINCFCLGFVDGCEVFDCEVCEYGVGVVVVFECGVFVGVLGV